MIALDLLLVSAVAVGAARETTNFDFGWRHQLGEPTGQPSLRDYDDSAWPVINAPHDVLINTGFWTTGNDTAVLNVCHVSDFTAESTECESDE